MKLGINSFMVNEETHDGPKIFLNRLKQSIIKNKLAEVRNIFHPFYNLQMRLESYQHAQNHGISAAKNILGHNSPYTQIPWMWSDQFDLNLQLVGICNDFDQEIQRGDILEEGIIYFFLKNNKIIGACGIGIAGKVGRDIRLAGKISESNIEIKIEELKNTEIKLNKLLKK